MTTVAIKDGIIAVDSFLWDSGADRVYGSTNKLFRSKDGWWCAGAGEASMVASFGEWFSKRSVKSITKAAWKDLPDKWSGASATILSPDGRSFFYEGNNVFVGLTSPFIADGSGAQYALMAMECGLSAPGAVMMTAKFDKATGGTVKYALAGAKTSMVYYENNQQLLTPSAVGGGGKEGPLLQGER